MGYACKLLQGILEVCFDKYLPLKQFGLNHHNHISLKACFAQLGEAEVSSPKDVEGVFCLFVNLAQIDF